MGPTEPYGTTCGNTDHYKTTINYYDTSNCPDKSDDMDDIIEDDKDIKIEIHKENKHCLQRQAVKQVRRSRIKHKKPHMTRRVM